LKNALGAGLGTFYESINRFLVQHDILPVIEKEKSGFKQEGASTKRRPQSSPRVEQSLDNTLGGEDLSVTLGGLGATSPSLNINPPRRRRATQAAQAPPLAPLQPDLAPPDSPHSMLDTGQFIAPQSAQQATHGQTTPAQAAYGQAAGSYVPPGGVAPGRLPPGQFGGGAPLNFDATFGGLSGAPAVYATPSLQQAYSTAQTQLALKRDLHQQMAGSAGVPAAIGSAYPERQVVDGLTAMQRSLAREKNPGVLGGESIKDRILKSIESAGGGEGHIGQAQADAIEVIANLFESLISDAFLTDGAKSNLARLQAPVHKVALMDNDFFEATNHPVRQVLNRVALVDDSIDENGVAQNERIASLIEQVNQQFSDDVSIFNPIVGELDEILREQRTRYQDNIAGVVQASVEQQKILQDRRSKDLSATDTSSIKKDLPPEWNKWLDRVRALAVGDRFVMNANTTNPFPVSLVWIGEDNEPFVLVDQKGHKVSTLTMQQVAMYLRRGTLKMLDPNAASAVDRALFGMVNRMHGDVEEQVTKDELTHFLNRKSFMLAIENNLPDQKKKDQGAALCQISIDNLKGLNERDGVEAGDSLLENVASILNATLGTKRITFGRLSGADLAVYWHKGGVVAAQKKLQDCIEKFSEIDLAKDDVEFKLSVAAGLVSVEDKLTPAKELLDVVNDACQTAKENSGKAIHIVGSENKYKEKLEQMVSYIGKAIERERLVFLLQKVRSLGGEAQMPAAHVVVSAEDRNGRIIPPSLFEQALEQSDRAFEVDTWLIKKSLAWIRDDEKVLGTYSAIIVPLSVAAVQRDDLANTVITELMETAVPPGRIAFEIADKDVVSNLTEVTDMMRTLTEFGCRFILDEFGSGQENYDYLKEVPADFVTIQSDFIRDAGENQKDFAMAKSINELAHFMGKRTLAKQERGEEIEVTLLELGIDFVFDRSRSSRIAEDNV
jgi:diguanylate cyclase (GGDEF)-like protein